MNKQLKEKIIGMIDSEFNGALRENIRSYISYTLMNQMDSQAYQINTFIEQKVRTKLEEELEEEYEEQNK